MILNSVSVKKYISKFDIASFEIARDYQLRHFANSRENGDSANMWNDRRIPN